MRERVAVVIPSARGGMAVSARRISDGLSAQGRDVSVIEPGRSAFARMRAICSARRRVGQHGVVLVFGTSLAPLVWATKPCRRGSRAILVIRNSPREFDRTSGARHRVRARVICSALRRLDLVLCNSSELAAEIEKFTGVLPLVVNNGVSDDTPRPVFRTGGIGVAVGRLEQQKQPLELVRSFTAQRHSLDLEFVGEGTLAEDLRRESTGDARVSFRGWRSDWRDDRRYSWLVLASAYEGFPNVVLEALSSGLAVVAAASATGVREVLDVVGSEAIRIESAQIDSWDWSEIETWVRSRSEATREQGQLRVLDSFGCDREISGFSAAIASVRDGRT